MKSTSLFGIIMLFLSTINFISCSEDNKKEITPFFIEKQSYEVMQNGYINISITNGSGNISISDESPTCINATYTKSVTNNTWGTILIAGNKKGATTLTVTDNVTQETETLNIKVTDTYLAYRINQSNHPALTNEVTMFLINNDQHDCYFFTIDHMTNKLSDRLIAKGTYLFSVEKDGEKSIPHLSLTYTSDSEGRFTIAEILPTRHKFDISESSNASYRILEQYLSFRWEELYNHVNRSSAVVAPSLTMQEVGSEYVVQGHINTFPQIPENILK